MRFTRSLKKVDLVLKMASNMGHPSEKKTMMTNAQILIIL